MDGSMEGSMEGSRINGRPWKQSVNKNTSSRIYGDNKVRPNKFSPSKFTNIIGTSKSLIKYRSSNYSQDQIKMGLSSDRSLPKQPVLGVKQGLKTPRSNSERSLDIEPIKITLKGEVFKNGDNMEIMRQLKIQFFRFKQKVLKQLKRQEEYLRQSVQEIYLALNKVKKAQIQPIPKSQFAQTYSSPINNIKLQYAISPKMNLNHEQLFKNIGIFSPQIPQPMIDKSKFKRQQKQQQINDNNENIISLIKEKFDCFSEIVSILKRDINEKTANYASHLPICME